MATVDPEFLATYKKLIDDGYAANFGDAIELEYSLASAANAEVSPDGVEARRKGILERGRKQ